MEAGRGGDAGELPSVTRVPGWRPISQRRRLRCRMARRSRKPGVAPGPPDPSCPREGDVARLSSHTPLVPSPSAQEGVLPSSPGPQVGGGRFSGIQKICVQPKAHFSFPVVSPTPVGPTKILASSVETQAPEKKKLSRNDSS